MQRVIKLRNWFAQSRKNRILFLAVIGCMAGIGAGYLYFHNPLKYPLPCLSRDHGIVLSGMWSRESELQYPAWKFPDCFLLQSGHGFSAAVSRNLFCDGCSRLGIDRKESCG